MTIDYEAAKRALIATRRKNVQAAVDELIYDAERSSTDAWANYDRAKDHIKALEHKVKVLEHVVRLHYGTLTWWDGDSVLEVIPYNPEKQA